MSKKQPATKKPAAGASEVTFEVRFVAPALIPEKIPLRAVSDALSAVQDLASGRDPFETAQVPPEKGIGLVDVRSGSAVYACVSRAPDEALANLKRVGEMLSAPDSAETIDTNGDGLVAALRPIQALSEVAKHIGCRLEVSVGRRRRRTLLTVEASDFKTLSERLLLTGEKTIIGEIQRVGGATGMRCLLRVPGRRRILYCDVKNKDLVRRLGQHLYEQIAATGTAVWIHRSWYIYRFTINNFTQPRIGDLNEAIEGLRQAGLDAWDHVRDPESVIRELRQ